MCQQLLLCPEAQTLFRYLFPVSIGLVAIACLLLLREIKETYTLLASKHKARAQQGIQIAYSLLAQAQEIVENVELQQLVVSEPVTK